MFSLEEKIGQRSWVLDLPSTKAKAKKKKKPTKIKGKQICFWKTKKKCIDHKKHPKQNFWGKHLPNTWQITSWNIYIKNFYKRIGERKETTYRGITYNKKYFKSFWIVVKEVQIYIKTL